MPWLAVWMNRYYWGNCQDTLNWIPISRFGLHIDSWSINECFAPFQKVYSYLYESIRLGWCDQCECVKSSRRQHMREIVAFEHFRDASRNWTLSHNLHPYVLNLITTKWTLPDFYIFSVKYGAWSVVNNQLSSAAHHWRDGQSLHIKEGNAGEITVRWDFIINFNRPALGFIKPDLLMFIVLVSALVVYMQGRYRN